MTRGEGTSSRCSDVAARSPGTVTSNAADQPDFLPEVTPPLRPQRQRVRAALAVVLPVGLALSAWSAPADLWLQARLAEGLAGLSLTKSPPNALPDEVAAVLAMFVALGTYTIGRLIPSALRLLALLLPLTCAAAASLAALLDVRVAFLPCLVAGLLGLHAARDVTDASRRPAR